jgi:hypothetical protein
MISVSLEEAETLIVNLLSALDAEDSDGCWTAVEDLFKAMTDVKPDKETVARILDIDL